MNRAVDPRAVQPTQLPILIEQYQGTATVTFNRPHVLNAFNTELLAEFDAFLDRVEQDKSVRSVILTGAGTTFSSGMDLKEAADSPLPTAPDEAHYRRLFAPLMRRCMRVWALDKPVIAAVAGHALGHACDLSLVSDITIASDDAYFGVPEIRHGGGVATLILPYLAGVKQTKELMLTGRSVSAAEAVRFGLVNRLVPREMLLTEARDLASRFESSRGDAVWLRKRLVNRTYEAANMRAAMNHALDALVLIFLSLPPAELKARSDLIARRGLRAFLKTRDAAFHPTGAAMRVDTARKNPAVPSQRVLYQITDGVATITLNRPRSRNAMTSRMREDVILALEAAEADDAVRVVILCGNGPSFSVGIAGKGSTAIPGSTVLASHATPLTGRTVGNIIWRLSKPVIASVHGACLEEACSIASLCDLTIAADDACFGRGDGAATAAMFLPTASLIGLKKGKELMLGGDTVGAVEAQRLGLVNTVVPRSRLSEETRAWAATLAAIPATALRLNKRVINAAYGLKGLDAAMDLAGDLGAPPS